MIDRRLIGILALMFILSTGVFTLFAGEKVREPLEILRNEWNLPREDSGVYLLPSEEGRYAYGIVVVARKPIRRLELVFVTLENASGILPQNLSRAAPGLHQAFLSLPEIGNLTSVIYDYRKDSPMRLDEIRFTLNVSGIPTSGALLDLTDPMRPVTPPQRLHSIATVQALLFGEDGSIQQYYRGYPDFFLDRNHSIIDITVQHNQNLTKYSQRTTQQGTSLLMTQAPPVGHLLFDDVEKDDQIFVSFAVNPAMVSTRETIIQMVLIFLDGEYYDGVTNLIRR